MPLGKWIFEFEATDGSGDRVEVDAGQNAPFYLQFENRAFAFVERRFQAEPGFIGGLSGFYEAMRTTPCPRPPQRPMEAPPEPLYGGWEPERAKTVADRLNADELRAKCEADPSFARALDSLKPEPARELGPSAAAREAAYLAAEKHAADQRCMDRLSGRGAKTQQPTTEFVDVGRPELVRVTR